MSTAGIPVLGSVTLSGATNIQRKERDYIIEHQIAGKDGGLVERVGSASTRWEIKGFLREANADSQYQSLIGLLGKTSNLSIPTFGSGYFLAASGTVVFVESFQGNWIPGVGYPRYDYTLKLVAVGGNSPSKTIPYSQAALVGGQIASADITGVSSTVALTGVTLGNTLVIAYGARTPTFTIGNTPTVSDSQSQTITSLVVNRGSGANSAGVYAQVFQITNALAGTHTITVQTTDINQIGRISIYELSGVGGSSVSSNFNTSITTISVSPAANIIANQVAIGAAGSSVSGGGGASFGWAGGGSAGSLTGDGTDASFGGVNGHSTAQGTQDFGAARQGTGTPNGMAVAGVVFS